MKLTSSLHSALGLKVSKGSLGPFLSLLSVATLAFSTLLVSCGPAQGIQDGNSSVESVEIPQTPIENQFKIGFCWAYITTAFIESAYKSKTGKDVNLSEEAMGFYRMAEGMLMLAQQFDTASIPQEFDSMGLEGWVIRTNEAMPDALKLVEKYGVVPESVWTQKFKDRAATEQLLDAVKANYLQLVQEKGAKNVTLDLIIQKALRGPGAFASAPPATFSVEGKTVSAREFATSTLQFRSSDYGLVEAAGPSGYARVVSATKRALARGLSVPMGMAINMDRLKNGRFTGAGVSATNRDAFFRDGGHAVLVTDFVNVGGRKGAVDSAALQTELQKSPDALDYLVAKNSWGKGAQSNETDVSLSGSPDGYYTLDQAFLRGEAHVSSQPDLIGIFSVVVPLDIAQNPLGSDRVN